MIKILIDFKLNINSVMTYFLNTTSFLFYGLL